MKNFFNGRPMATRQVLNWMNNKSTPMKKVSIRPNSASCGGDAESIQIQNLPVRPLEQTLKKYLNTVRPFLTENQFENTECAANEFLEKEGKELQSLLEQRAKEKKNWLEEWWMNTAYLEYRDPVALFSSPGLVWPSQPFSDNEDRLRYTASLISNALIFNDKLNKRAIPQEKVGKEPLDMEQYYKVFGTSRIPLTNRDALELQNPEKPSDYIIVMVNDNIFSCRVWDSEGRPLHPNIIYTMLLDVVKKSETPGLPVGVLTSDHRDRWARAYTLLLRDETNAKALKAIERSLFVVCLDNPLPEKHPRNQLSHTSGLLLHGGGKSKGNAANRWFDKTIQFIVGSGQDGVGISYEHSPAEGNPIGVLSDFIISQIRNLSCIDVIDVFPTPEKLEFKSSPAIEQAIQEATENIDGLAQDLDIFAFKFDKFGKSALKSLKASPDSFIQIAIQYAYYKLHGEPAAQYESGTLRKFIGGRTDVIRTCSLEALEFCTSEGEPNKRYAVLQAALSAHKKYAIETISFNGVDRHLLGLKMIAKENDLPIPKFFEDEGYVKSTQFKLSTSNVPAKNDAVMVYAPLVSNGYACCYNPRDDDINFGTSAWESGSDTDIDRFQKALTEALEEMHEILACGPPNLQSKL